MSGLPVASLLSVPCERGWARWEEAAAHLRYLSLSHALPVPLAQPEHLLRDVPLQPLRVRQRSVWCAQAVTSVRVAQVEDVRGQDKLQGEGQAERLSASPAPRPLSAYPQDPSLGPLPPRGAR